MRPNAIFKVLFFLLVFSFNAHIFAEPEKEPDNAKPALPPALANLSAADKAKPALPPALANLSAADKAKPALPPALANLSAADKAKLALPPALVALSAADKTKPALPPAKVAPGAADKTKAAPAPVPAKVINPGAADKTAAAVVTPLPQEDKLKTSLENSLKNALTDNLRLSNENDELKKKAASLEEYSRASTVLSNNLKDEIARLQKDTSKLDEANKTITKLSDDLTALKAQADDLNAKLKTSAEEVDMLTADNKFLSERLSSNFLENENKQLKSNLDGTSKALFKATADMASSVKEKERLHKETAVLHYNLGYMLFKDGDYKGSSKEFKRSIELDPLNESAYFNLGLIYDEYLNDNKQAMGYYTKYLEISPENKDDDAAIAARDSVKNKLLKASLKERAKVDSIIDSNVR